MSQQTITRPQAVTGIDLTDVDLFVRGDHSLLFEQLMVSGLRFKLSDEVRRLRSNFLLGITRLPVEVI